MDLEANNLRVKPLNCGEISGVKAGFKDAVHTHGNPPT
jgi:hypothetical protein